MASFNKVILMGNLTRDPELKYLPNNTAVCEFGLAVNHRWRDKEGNQRDEVCFVDIAAFGKQGETINQYMTKGRSILIEGRLKYDSWTSQDGTKRSKHSVVIESFTFVGSREGAPAGGEGGGEPPRRAPQRGPGGGGAAAGGYRDQGAGGEHAPPSGDEIPF